MKKFGNIVGTIVVLAFAIWVIVYYATGQEHKNQVPLNNSTSTVATTTQTDKDQVKANWVKFFNGSTNAQDKIGLLQNGQEFAQVIQAQAQSPTAKATTATVSDVSLNGNSATVTYTINIDKQPALSNQKGQAVKVGSTWKVGDTAFCGLLQLSGTVPPNCPGASQ